MSARVMAVRAHVSGRVTVKRGAGVESSKPKPHPKLPKVERKRERVLDVEHPAR